jgi:hypothetical protein
MVPFSLCGVTYLATAALAATVPSPLPWEKLAITAPANERYLHRTKGEEPFMWVADTNWELFHRLNRTGVDLYLADRAAKGFNVIQAVVLSKYNVTTLPIFYGDLAIDNEDVTQLNECYFSYVDFVATRAAEYGILLCLVPTWGRYINGGWYGTEGPRLFNESNAYIFGQLLGRRYPGLPKMMGGDTNADWADNLPQAQAQFSKDISQNPWDLIGPITDTRGVWAAMMRGFREEEAKLGYESFVTFQGTGGWITGYPLPYGHNVRKLLPKLPLMVEHITKAAISTSMEVTALYPWMLYNLVTRDWILMLLSRQ